MTPSDNFDHNQVLIIATDPDEGRYVIQFTGMPGTVITKPEEILGLRPGRFIVCPWFHGPHREEMLRMLDERGHVDISRLVPLEDMPMDDAAVDRALSGIKHPTKTVYRREGKVPKY